MIIGLPSLVGHLAAKDGQRCGMCSASVVRVLTIIFAKA
jgi:hypothetical protein